MIRMSFFFRHMAPDPTLLQRLVQRQPFAHLAEEVVVAVMVTADTVRRGVENTASKAGLTLQQYNVLRILRGAGQVGLPTLAVGARMVEQAPGVTRLLDRLEAKGLVRRSRCPTDRRQVLCWIEPAGKALIDSLDAPMVQVAEELTRRLPTDEQVTLVELLARLRQGAEGRTRANAAGAAPSTDPQGVDA